MNVGFLGGPSSWGRGRGGEGWLVSHLQTPLSEVGARGGWGFRGVVMAGAAASFLVPSLLLPQAPPLHPGPARHSVHRRTTLGLPGLRSPGRPGSLFLAVRLPARAWCPREGAVEMCSVPRLTLPGPAMGWTRLTCAFGPRVPRSHPSVTRGNLL